MLTQLIDQNDRAPGLKTEMHFIRECRNKVHPNVISDFEDVTREDSILCRSTLEKLLLAYSS